MYKAYSFEEEEGDFTLEKDVKSIDELIKIAINNIITDYIQEEDGVLFIYVTLGTIGEYQDTIDVDYFIDEIAERTCSEFDDDGELKDYLTNVSRESKEWLESKLYEIWDEFKKREKIKPLYIIDEKKTFKVYLKEIGEGFEYEIINYEEEK